MLNHIVLMGRLTRDPELRRTAGGTAVTSFTLAVDHDFPNKETGERGVDFIDVVAWRQTGEFVSKYFAKGRMAVVSGRLQIRAWTDKDGNKRRSAEVVADNVYFGDTRKDSEGAGYPGGSSYAGNGGSSAYRPYNDSYAAPAGGNYAAPAAAPVSDFAMLEDDDSELPF